jgi:hypothetical protein
MRNGCAPGVRRFQRCGVLDGSEVRLELGALLVSKFTHPRLRLDAEFCSDDRRSLRRVVPRTRTYLDFVATVDLHEEHAIVELLANRDVAHFGPHLSVNAPSTSQKTVLYYFSEVWPSSEV